MCIALGRLHLAVAQQLADHLEGSATADQERGEGVTQIVDPDIRDADLLLEARPEPADFLYRLAGGVTGKEPRRPLDDSKAALGSAMTGSTTGRG